MSLRSGVEAQAGQNDRYIDDNKLSDNIGFVINVSEYEDRVIPQNQVQPVYAGRTANGLMFWAVCWVQLQDLSTVLCNFAIYNSGSEDQVVTRTDAALINDTGQRWESMDPEFLTGDYARRALTTSTIPAGQGVEAYVGFAGLADQFTNLMRIEIRGEGWEEPVVLLIMGPLEIH